MDPFVPLIRADEVPAGKAVRVQALGNCYVVCNDNGSFHVADCVCPHAGGPLGGADVRDGMIVCPIHHWPWDLKTGLTNANYPDMQLKIYTCELRNGTVFAAISPPSPCNEYDLDARGQ